MQKMLAPLCLVAAVYAPAGFAANEVKVGFLSTLSGPGAVSGVDIRDGFALGLRHTGNKLGALEAELILADDQQSPVVAKQAVDRLLKKDKVDFVTGTVFSNVLLAVAPSVFEAKTFYVSANAGPSQLAGNQCNPYFFNVAWQNDNLHEAMGKYMQDKKVTRVAVLSANYQAGKDAVEGFKRYFTSPLVTELYAKFGQIDYSAEIAQLQFSNAEALYIFLPAGMGISFIKQFAASGVGNQIKLFSSGFSADEDIIGAVGDPMVGLYNSTHWAFDMDNPQNRQFVTDFRAAFGRTPSIYAQQGYDAAMLIDSAVKAVDGNLDDKAGLQQALEAAKFPSLRGSFKFNTNHFPIQDYYLRVIEKTPQGKITNKLVGKIFNNHADAYVSACRMRAL